MENGDAFRPIVYQYEDLDHMFEPFKGVSIAPTDLFAASF